jgi:uncharacterized protein YeeX (DUF496 family)
VNKLHLLKLHDVLVKDAIKNIIKKMRKDLEDNYSNQSFILSNENLSEEQKTRVLSFLSHYEEQK